MVNEIIEEGAELNSETPISEEKDDLTKAIEEQMDKLRRQSVLLGAQAICSTILQKITLTMRKPGKTSYRDYERLVKDISDFCTTGLSRKVNLDGTTSTIEEEGNKDSVEE